MATCSEHTLRLIGFINLFLIHMKKKQKQVQIFSKSTTNVVKTTTNVFSKGSFQFENQITLVRALFFYTAAGRRCPNPQE
jgi:hypothetical protein